VSDDVEQQQRLLAAIVDAPDDDAARLVYADWLQSRGDPHGEFIQLQCQLAAAPDDERGRAIRIAENKLFAAHGTKWLEPIRRVLPRVHELAMPHKLEFHRGFVEEAHLTLDCLSVIDELYAAAPLIRRLKLSPTMVLGTPIKQPRLGAALASPHLARLRRLSLSLGGGGNAVAREIAAAPALRGLTELQLHLSVWGEGIGLFETGATELVLDDAGVSALAASEYLHGLDALLLDNNRITSGGVSVIARGDWRLRRLELGFNLLDPTTLARSLAGPALVNLEYLGLSGVSFDPKSIAALVSSPALANLRELDLEKCHLGVAGVTALCDAFALPSLRRLRLERNSLGDAGAIALASCERLAALTELEAGHNRIGHKGATAIASSAQLARLARLTLNEPRWKPETAALFAASPTLANAKIYLQGRLVARKKSKATKEIDPAYDVAAAVKATDAPAKKASRPEKSGKAVSSESKRAPRTATAKPARTAKSKRS
jgi:uncharacterized protein (TIGR02996 family)